MNSYIPWDLRYRRRTDPLLSLVLVTVLISVTLKSWNKFDSDNFFSVKNHKRREREVDDFSLFNLLFGLSFTYDSISQTNEHLHIVACLGNKFTFRVLRSVPFPTPKSTVECCVNHTPTLAHSQGVGLVRPTNLWRRVSDHNKLVSIWSD